MAEKSCYFCKKSTHVSEYCRDFPTLRSRYSYLSKHKQSNCLCPKYEPIDEVNTMCKCRKICEVCFQHHHIAMCPKRDLEHPSNPIIFPEALSLFSHPSPFAQRFFELCDSSNQYKLRKTCHHFLSLQPIKLQLKPTFNSVKLSEPRNVVYNKYGEFQNIKNLKDFATEKKFHFNLDNVALKRCEITKENLNFLSKNDPNTISFEYCKLNPLLSLQDILEAFPYAYDITYIGTVIPKTWILNFLCVERKVGLRKIAVNDYSLSFDLEDLITLFEQHEELVVTVTAKSIYAHHSTAFLKLDGHSRFSPSNSEGQYNLCIVLKSTESMQYYRFQRLN